MTHSSKWLWDPGFEKSKSNEQQLQKATIWPVYPEIKHNCHNLPEFKYTVTFVFVQDMRGMGEHAPRPISVLPTMEAVTH